MRAPVFLASLLRSIRRFFNHGKRLPTYLGVFGTIFVLYLQIAAPSTVFNLLNRLEYLVYDQRMAVTPKPSKSAGTNIVIVDLDERSLQAEGQYPWNRIKVGQLTERLSEYGALVIGFDITFPEPDRGVRDLLESIDLSQLDPAFETTLNEIEDQVNGDIYFANSMQKNTDVVLAINFNSQSSVSYNALPDSIVDIGQALAQAVTVPNMLGFTGNINSLHDAAAGSGSMNQQPDADGVVRRVPLIIRYGTELFPTLSLEMLRVYNFLESYELLTQNYNNLEVVTAVRIGAGAGAFTIPTDGRGQVYVPYVGRSSLNNNAHYPYISATDVLRGTLSDDEKLALKNSLVLVGTSAPGLGDIHAMPLQRIYPGVEVHANMLNALLDSIAATTVNVSGTADTESVFASFKKREDIFFPYRPDWTAGAMFLVSMVLGLALAMAFPFLGAATMAVSGLLLMVLSTWLNFRLWTAYKLDFPLSLLLFLILLITTINLIYGFFAESRTRKMIKGMFDQYVPPAHIDSMLANPDSYSFEGESKELTVLFADIRSFTSISEVLSATQLKRFLNDFFTPITGIIFDHHGTIDKYVGDMVMAFWGAPLDDLDHRGNAVRSALRMLKKTEELKVQFLEAGLPEVNIGVGLNTGLMNVGDMGSTYRRSYTVLGDAVNLGSRLESLTKFYGIRLLVGEETATNLDGFLFRTIDKVKVKGKDEAITCYEPLCELADATQAQTGQLGHYHNALGLYYEKEWNAAQRAFSALVEAEPDTLLYRIYLERIASLRESELPENWDGSYTHTSK
ncbi:MAG: adenylate cyclase [Pseudohongiellaceae bacterium]|jgi:adenylate cyclase